MRTLFEAIYAHFKEDPLAGKVTAMYNTIAPANAVFPYIVFSLVSDKQDFDSDNLFEDTMIQFNIFSNKASSAEVCNIFEYLKGQTSEGTGYDFYALEVENYTTLLLKRDTARFFKVENVWQYNVLYNCLLNWIGEAVTERLYLYNLLGWS